MFAEMLTHYEEKIFLEAIDQYFESELFEDFDTIKQKGILSEKDIIKSEETDSQIDKEKETDIEIMNIKFYEALNIDSSSGIKDISTDLESEDSLNTEKVFIKIRDYLILSKEAIENNNKKVLESYKNKIIFGEKNKELFKNNKNRDDIKY